MLGECVAAATLAIHAASSSGLSAGLVAVAVGSLLLVFSVWWWYFEHPSEGGLRMSRNVAFLWGYGHYFVLGSVGALGAGLGLAAAGFHGHARSTDATTAGLAIAVPVVVYLGVTGILQGRLDRQPAGRMAIVTGAGLAILLLGALASVLGLGMATLLMGIVVAVLVACDKRRGGKVPAAAGRRRGRRPGRTGPGT